MNSGRPLRIYVASSWRNPHQQAVVGALRAEGHEVYDFRHPSPGETGFNWSLVDPHWRQWTPAQFREALQHPAARHGYALDMHALAAAAATILVLPCGRSSHLELGYAVAAGQQTFVLCESALDEPELMYSMSTVCLDVFEIIAALRGYGEARTGT